MCLVLHVCPFGWVLWACLPCWLSLKVLSSLAARLVVLSALLIEFVGPVYPCGWVGGPVCSIDWIWWSCLRFRFSLHGGPVCYFLFGLMVLSALLVQFCGPACPSGCVWWSCLPFWYILIDLSAVLVELGGPDCPSGWVWWSSALLIQFGGPACASG